MSWSRFFFGLSQIFCRNFSGHPAEQVVVGLKNHKSENLLYRPRNATNCQSHTHNQCILKNSTCDHKWVRVSEQIFFWFVPDFLYKLFWRSSLKTHNFQNMRFCPEIATNRLKRAHVMHILKISPLTTFLEILQSRKLSDSQITNLKMCLILHKYIQNRQKLAYNRHNLMISALDY